MPGLTDARERQARLVAALRAPERYPHSTVQPVDLIETHISWVLLAGEYAYKIKKAVCLGFLDFSELDARRRFCEEELRLNRRTAPMLYLEVVALTGTPSEPSFGGTGPAMEYAVKMRRFPQEALLDRMAKDGKIDAGLIDRLAHGVAAFHETTSVAGPASEFGSPSQIAAAALANFAEIEQLIGDIPAMKRLDGLRCWTENELIRLAHRFLERKARGRVRECHGDLHLGNIVLINGEPTPFDCIEFSEKLRWIDVMNELAFLVMDLLDHGLWRLAFRCLNDYLEVTGDYEGAAIMHHYLVYRAMVRAKVACIRTHQGDVAPAILQAAAHQFAGYLDLADRLTTFGNPALVLMHGVSGSGKTTLSQDILERIGAIRVRSDIERKRLHGLAAESHTAGGVGGGLYEAQASRRTYERLAEIARGTISAGWPLIIDATFLKRAERDVFRRIARDAGCPFAIIICRAPDDLLRKRLALRQRQGHDASEATVAVLEHQLVAGEPLDAVELGEAIVADMTQPRPADAVEQALVRRLGIRKSCT